jgi:hypothetical protein
MAFREIYFNIFEDRSVEDHIPYGPKPDNENFAVRLERGKGEVHELIV